MIACIEDPAAELPAETVGVDKSIAVLPFVNMSSDAEQEYFSDDLSEELHERLALESLRHGESLNSFCIKALKKGVEELIQGG